MSAICQQEELAGSDPHLGDFILANARLFLRTVIIKTIKGGK